MNSKYAEFSVCQSDQCVLADFGTKTFSVFRLCACNKKCNEIVFAIALALENTTLFLDIV
jgi:hypothetical protein